VVGATEPFGLAIDYLQAPPKHPFFVFLTEQLENYSFRYGLPHASKVWIAPRARSDVTAAVMLASGPNFFSRIYTNWRRLHPDTRDIKIMTYAVSGRRATVEHPRPNAFFKWQAPAASWHHNSGDTEVRCAVRCL
jgi:mannosyltransferase OCH1-like enzyme